MNGRRSILDINTPPSYRFLDPFSGFWIDSSQVLPATVEHLNLTMEGVPCVKAPATMTAPTSLPSESAQGLKIIED
jgi:hypothetical protein